MAEQLRGKPVVQAMKEELMQRVEALKAKELHQSWYCAWCCPDDLYYEGGAKKTCDSIGLAYEVFEYPEDVGQAEFEQAVKEIGAKRGYSRHPDVFTLPKSLDEKKIRALIPVEKDVDSLTLGSAGKVFADDETGFPPCTPTACMEILKHYKIPLEGKRVTVVGRSLVVGKPVAMLLMRENATVTICHSRTKDLPAVCKEADIVVAAIGRAKMINADYVKPGQIVIDVGINPIRTARVSTAVMLILILWSPLWRKLRRYPAGSVPLPL